MAEPAPLEADAVTFIHRSSNCATPVCHLKAHHLTSISNGLGAAWSNTIYSCNISARMSLSSPWRKENEATAKLAAQHSAYMFVDPYVGSMQRCLLWSVGGMAVFPKPSSNHQKKGTVKENKCFCKISYSITVFNFYRSVLDLRGLLKWPFLLWSFIAVGRSVCVGLQIYPKVPYVINIRIVNIEQKM